MSSSSGNPADFDIAAYCANVTSLPTSIQADCYLYETITTNIDDLSQGVNVFFLLATGALVFLQQAGFALVCGGAVQEKSVINILLKNLLDSCCGAIGFWAVGFAFALGGSDPNVKTFIGSTNFFLRNYDEGFDELIHWYFQFAFAQTAATVVAGVIAERSKMAGYLWYSAFITSFVYPVIVHNSWSASGYLSPFNNNPFLGVGVIDFAGSGCVHSTGGFTALIAANILGPRRGRFHDAKTGRSLDKPQHFKAYSPALQLLGTFLLWVGWIGFNPGSAIYTTTPAYSTTVALSAVTTTLSAATGAISAMLLDTFLEYKRTNRFSYEVSMACNGCLAGLVAITANCAVVSPWAAVIIGAVGGWVYYIGEKLLVRFRVDDAVDAIPVHLGNGLWGLISTGLFANPEYMKLVGYNPNHPGLFYSGGRDWNLMACQICSFLFIVTWVTVVMIPYFLILKHTGQFRVSPEDEMVGLDIAHHRIPPQSSSSFNSSSKGMMMSADAQQQQQQQAEEMIILQQMMNVASSSMRLTNRQETVLTNDSDEQEQQTQEQELDDIQSKEKMLPPSSPPSIWRNGSIRRRSLSNAQVMPMLDDHPPTPSASAPLSPTFPVTNSNNSNNNNARRVLTVQQKLPALPPPPQPLPFVTGTTAATIQTKPTSNESHLEDIPL